MSHGKLLSIITLVAVLTTGSLRAQVHPVEFSRWSIGFRGGMNAAKISLDSVPNGYGTSSLAGLIGGVQVEYAIARSWSFVAGAFYDQKGVFEDATPTSTISTPTKFNGFIDSNSSVINHFKEDLRANYIEFPIGVKYSIVTGVFHPFAFAGPSIGILVGAKQTENRSVTVNAISPNATRNNEETSVTGPASETNYDVTTNFRATNLSLKLGAGMGYDLYLGGTLTIQAEYSYGLTNVISSQIEGHCNTNTCYEPLTSKTPTALTRDIHVTAGMMFAL